MSSVHRLLGMMCAVCPRLRRDPAAPDGVYFECCQAAQGWDTEAGHVLYIIRVAEDTIGAIGRKWVATHAPRGSTYLQVTALIPGGGVLAFGSNDENITAGGGHEWHW